MILSWNVTVAISSPFRRATVPSQKETPVSYRSILSIHSLPLPTHLTNNNASHNNIHRMFFLKFFVSVHNSKLRWSSNTVSIGLKKIATKRLTLIPFYEVFQISYLIFFLNLTLLIIRAYIILKNSYFFYFLFFFVKFNCVFFFLFHFNGLSNFK